VTPSPPLRAALLALAALCLPARAAANGRFPTSGYVVVGPGPGSSLIALRTTFGLVVSHDGGRRWGWTCEEAFGGASGYDPSLAIGFDGSLIATVPTGLSLSRSGCAWERPRGTPMRAIVDVTVDASGRTMFGMTGPTGADDTIYRSTDGGATWEARAVMPGFFTETIEVAPSDPSRVYVSGFLRGGIAVLYRSDDGGMSVREVTRDFGRGSSAFISGVDPTRPDTLYVRASVGFGTVLLRSTDGGATLREVGSTADSMVGFALSDDGSTVWIGSTNRTEGLQRSVMGGPFRRVAASVTVRCLRYHAGVLYVCADEADDGYLLGCSTNGGDRIDPLVSGRSLLGVSDRCDSATPVGMTCDSLWPSVRMTLTAIDAGPIPTPVGHDASLPDAAAEGGAGDAARDAADGGDAAEAGMDATPEAALDVAPEAPTLDVPVGMDVAGPEVAADVPSVVDAPLGMDAADVPALTDTGADVRAVPPPPPNDCQCRAGPTGAAPRAALLLSALCVAVLRRRRRA